MKKNTKILLTVISCVFAVLSLVLIIYSFTYIREYVRFLDMYAEMYDESKLYQDQYGSKLYQDRYHAFLGRTIYCFSVVFVSLACIFSSVVIFFLLNPSEKLKAGYNKWATERKRKKLEKLQTELEDVSESNDGQ